MAQYMLQFSYTSDAWAALGRKPADRSKPLAALATNLGAKLISLHYTMGDWDGVAIIHQDHAPVHGQGDNGGYEEGRGAGYTAPRG